ncbi:MAG: nitrate/sulfonate/bicarbonate ABC transporter ATP-binding protein [Candidatus Thorarchaeota archaeon]|nr:MAG: nitrate/sulfonate/bicarbonate ABC transporter ATP-binding protein [Candidatus Thorarchaeota archaeon]
MAILDFQSVSKSFTKDMTRIDVLEEVSFTVDEEFVCIVGPSGCGKSTLLRIAAGLEHADSGQILFKGDPVIKPTQKIAMVFQLFGLLPWKTAIENVMLPLEIAGLDKETRSQRAREHLHNVELDGFEGTYPHDLSGGMKQRVGIARALALRPDVLLMDEPFSSLDELTAKTLREMVLKIWREPEPPNTFIMVSHNVEEAVLMADRVLVMSSRPGKVIGEVQVDIPRPRIDHCRGTQYFDSVDDVVGLLEKGKKMRPISNNTPDHVPASE